MNDDQEVLAAIRWMLDPDNMPGTSKAYNRWKPHLSISFDPATGWWRASCHTLGGMHGPHATLLSALVGLMHQLKWSDDSLYSPEDRVGITLPDWAVSYFKSDVARG